MNKNEIIEIAGKSFELVPNTSDPLGYLLKPVEEKKPVKAETYWIDLGVGFSSGDFWYYGCSEICPPGNNQFKTVRPMKREDVARYIDDGVFIESERLALICNRLEELGLIQEGES